MPGELVTVRFDLHDFKICIDECYMCVIYHEDHSQNAFGECGVPWGEIIAPSHHPALWWTCVTFYEDSATGFPLSLSVLSMIPTLREALNKVLSSTHITLKLQTK